MLLSELTATSAHRLFVKGLLTPMQFYRLLERIVEREYGDILSDM